MIHCQPLIRHRGRAVVCRSRHSRAYYRHTNRPQEEEAQKKGRSAPIYRSVTWQKIRCKLSILVTEWVGTVEEDALVTHRTSGLGSEQHKVGVDAILVEIGGGQ